MSCNTNIQVMYNEVYSIQSTVQICHPNPNIIVCIIHVQSNNDRLCFCAVLLWSLDADDSVWCIMIIVTGTKLSFHKNDRNCICG